MRPEDLVFATVILPLLGAAFALCANMFPKGKGADTVEFIGAGIGLLLPLIVLANVFPLVTGGNAIEGVIGSWHEGIGITFSFD
ncbi:MAG: hypothetical protein PHR90_07450, partial [Sphaerochaetaceae bacterium]|nr:hypothetical protein [Sphaerochaetaceae bacterium]